MKVARPVLRGPSAERRWAYPTEGGTGRRLPLRLLVDRERLSYPIEMSFSKLKAYLRKAAERTQRSLRRRIGLFVPRLGADECANYFAHAGYVSSMSGIPFSCADILLSRSSLGTNRSGATLQ